MSLKDLLSPFFVWQRAFEKPWTNMRPIEERPGAPAYRGFHINLADSCIGCGSCHTICQNEAIDMVPVEEFSGRPGDSGLRPRFDYGRCCWCALCVDICTANSLHMSNEYTWLARDPTDYHFTAGVEEKPWQDSELGYHRAEDYHLYPPKRIEMDMLTADESVQSFDEVVNGYSEEQAKLEADRCVECGICVATCPAHMDVPDYIRSIRDGDFETGLQLMYRTNPFPATCGRICTHRCEEVCPVGIQGQPIAIRWLKRFIVDQVDSTDYARILDSEIVENGHKVAVIGAGHIEHEQNKFGPFDMAQELMPQPDPLVRTLDQGGDIGDLQPAEVGIFQGSDDGIDRGKGIRRDLGMRMRQPAEQGRLAGIRITHQPDVGHELQLEPQRSFLTFCSFGKFTRRLVGGGLVMNVADAAAAALGHHQFLAGLKQFSEEFMGFGFGYHRAGGHLDDAVVAVAAVAV